MLDSGYFNAARLQSLVAQHLSGRHDHSTPLWMLIMFDAFLRLHERAPARCAIPSF